MEAGEDGELRHLQAGVVEGAEEAHHHYPRHQGAAEVVVEAEHRCPGTQLGAVAGDQELLACQLQQGVLGEVQLAAVEEEHRQLPVVPLMPLEEGVGVAAAGVLLLRLLGHLEAAVECAVG